MGTPFGVAKPSSNLSGEPQPENAGSQTKISREATDQKPEEVFKPEKPSHTLSGQQLAEPVQDCNETYGFFVNEFFSSFHTSRKRRTHQCSPTS